MPADDLITEEHLWPILIHRTIGIPSVAKVDALMARAEGYLARRTPHVVIFDNTRGGRVPSYTRARSVRWIKQYKRELETYCMGIGLVVGSPALRFILSTVMLVTAHDIPTEVFTDVDEAIRWGRQRLAAEASA